MSTVATRTCAGEDWSDEPGVEVVTSAVLGFGGSPGLRYPPRSKIDIGGSYV
jgi:hypothetical protein